MAKAYYEFKDKTSSKFWEIGIKGKAVTVRFGKIGTDGQTTVKTCGTSAAAAAHAAKVTAEKVKKGYRPGAAAVERGGARKSRRPTATRLKGAVLVAAVQDRRSVKARDAIIEACGYDLNSASICEFYDALVDALGFDRINLFSPALRRYLHKHGGGRGPMIKDGKIHGRYLLSIDPDATKKRWNEENWDSTDRGQDGPYETGNPHAAKGYWEPHFDYDSAMASAYLPPLRDLVRPCYRSLDEGPRLEEWLREHGEHPNVLLDIAKDLVPVRPTHFWRLLSDREECGFEPTPEFERRMRRNVGAIDDDLSKGTIVTLAPVRPPRHLVVGQLNVPIAEGVVNLQNDPGSWKPLTEQQFQAAIRKPGCHVYGIDEIIRFYMQV